MKLLQHRPSASSPGPPWLLITAPTPLPAGAAGCSPPPMCKSKLALKLSSAVHVTCHWPGGGIPLPEGVPGALERVGK